MSERLDDVKSNVDASVEEMDTRVEYHDKRLRDKYGMNTVLARTIDLVAIAFGLYLVVEWGLFYKALGLIVLLGGMFGFLYNGVGSE